MDKLKQLMAGCECGVFMRVNEHRNYYESVEQYLSKYHDLEIDPEVMQKMTEMNTIIEVQFYPFTPIGSYIVYHYDLDAALNQALELLEQAKQQRSSAV